ncbi:major facilitator superfamily domain-containing protein [Xylariales sp. PMI_506]|nr:major facilitator superfamily domain-containing protein [Xylariales sp. PMI_506]
MAAAPLPLTELEKGIVGWESFDDTEYPQNFPARRKWFLLGLLSFITFLSPFASSIPAPGVGLMAQDFGVTSKILESLSVSIFVLGFAVGPLLLSPMSELYGRQTVFNTSNVVMTLFQIGCALSPNIGALIAFRFLTGAGGSGCLSVGGGIIADMFPIEQRGMANAMFTMGPLFGPVLGPILGGFIAQRAGWRWIFWVLLAACGFGTLVNMIFSKETNAAVLISRKTKRLRKELSRDDLQSGYDVTRPTNASSTTVLVRSLTRPIRILFGSPVYLLPSIHLSFVFGLLYLLFTTVSTLFTGVYHWPVELAGLAYLGMGIGFLLGLIVFAKTSDPTIVRLTKANNGVYEPEMRLASCFYFALFVPISFFWYGWTADKHVHWIVPIIGLIPFGFGAMGILAPVQAYFIDASGPYAASAVAGLIAMRCLFGTFLPLAGPAMYDALGLGWGNSLLGFIALGLIPVPLLLHHYGAALRQKFPIRFS